MGKKKYSVFRKFNRNELEPLNFELFKQEGMGELIKLLKEDNKDFHNGKIYFNKGYIYDDFMKDKFTAIAYCYF